MSVFRRDREALDRAREAIMRPSVDHSLLSPSGHISKRAKAHAVEKLRVELFGKEGLAMPTVAQPSDREVLLRRAAELRALADRGMKVRAYRREADRLEAQAAGLVTKNPGGKQLGLFDPPGSRGTEASIPTSRATPSYRGFDVLITPDPNVPTSPYMVQVRPTVDPDSYAVSVGHGATREAAEKRARGYVDNLLAWELPARHEKARTEGWARWRKTLPPVDVVQAPRAQVGAMPEALAAARKLDVLGKETQARIDTIDRYLAARRAQAAERMATRTRAPAKAKLRTFKEAQRAILVEFDELPGDRWRVESARKVPYVTHPSGRARLWFKAQAIYYAIGPNPQFREARSLTSDYRTETAAHLAGWIDRILQRVGGR